MISGNPLFYLSSFTYALHSSVPSLELEPFQWDDTFWSYNAIKAAPKNKNKNHWNPSFFKDVEFNNFLTDYVIRISLMHLDFLYIFPVLPVCDEGWYIWWCRIYVCTWRNKIQRDYNCFCLFVFVFNWKFI